jgi:anti-sigma regulatory factor (Ser/Thr protein kinase)
MAGPERAPETLRITTELADLARLYPWLDEAGARFSLPKKVLHAMQVVAEEVVMNAAMHAYAPGSRGEITVRVSAQDGVAALVVEDAGPAFDPVAAAVKPPAKTLAEAKPGGHGLRFLKHYCQDISYLRTHDLNQLTLRFPY